MFGKKKAKKSAKLEMDTEHFSASFPLKGDRTLNVTDSRLISSHRGEMKDEVYGSHMGIPLKNIQMVTPIKKNIVRVQFTMLHPKPKTEMRLKHEYTMKTNDAQSVCDYLKTTLSEMFSYVENNDGRLLLKEKPTLTTRALSGKGDGTLYVTSTAIYFESDHEGLTFMLPLTMYHDCEVKKNTLVFNYEEIHTNGRLLPHEFKLRMDNVKHVHDVVVGTYGKSVAHLDSRLKYLEEQFSHLSGKELKKILVEKRKDAPKIIPFSSHIDRTTHQCNKNALELEEYAFKLAEKKFGETRPITAWCYCSIGFPKDSVWGVKGTDHCCSAGSGGWCIDGNGQTWSDPAEWYKALVQGNADYHFIVMEARLILCALLADVPLEKLGDHTDSYVEMIKEFQKDFDNHRHAEMDYVEAYIKLKDMKDNSKDAGQFKRLLQNPDYIQYKEQYERSKAIREKYYPSSHRRLPHVNGFDSPLANLQKKYVDVEFSFTEYHWKTTYAKRAEIEFLTLSRRIYDEWKKNVNLENFTDDSDLSWVDNILANYPYPERDAAVVPDLKTKIMNEYSRSQGVKESLQSFRLDKIPAEDVINNDCWYDRERKMWFSRCEKALSLASSIAVMKSDEARKECGYIAFGFSKDQVVNVHGLPAVEIPYNVFPIHNPNLPHRTPPKPRHVILTAVPSSITPSKTRVATASDPTPAYPFTEAMIRDANTRAIFVENAPYTQTIKYNYDIDKDIVVRECEDAKKSGRFIHGIFPGMINSPLLDFETIDPEIGIMNSGLMIDDTPSRFSRFLFSSDGLVRDGTIRGIPASSGSFDSPLNVAVRMNAQRLGDDYPKELLPLYERLRRHLFSVTTLCGVLTKPADHSEAESEFNANQHMFDDADDVLSYVEEKF